MSVVSSHYKRRANERECLKFVVFKITIIARCFDKTIEIHTSNENNEFTCYTESILYYLQNDNRNMNLSFILSLIFFCNK